ncbi:MAG: hypothetical protein MNPFHGCM_00212 [Gemmatimonadaceae bacterium]|nr:hypothetical protein [Gemmatimonadaceae bacterium]
MRTTIAMGLVAVVVLGCGSSRTPVASGPFRCPSPAPGSVSYGCALVTGIVVGPSGQPLDGISGAVRATDACGCRHVAIPVDSVGRFSITIQRTLQPPTTNPDTATIAIYAGATAARYPRSVTGDPYFDTASVLLRFASVGSIAEQYAVQLRILFPSL